MNLNLDDLDKLKKQSGRAAFKPRAGPKIPAKPSGGLTGQASTGAPSSITPGASGATGITYTLS